MKKNILAVAIAGALVAPLAANAAAHAAAPTLYGQFNVALDSVTDSGTAVVNRNSRLGVKGSEDLGNGLKAVYQFETTLTVNGTNDDGKRNSGFGGQRNTFVGVAGGFGTVFAGRHDTPLRMIQPSDRFNDNALLGNNTNKFGGLVGNAGEDRLNDMVAYISPKFNNFQVIIGGVTTATDKDDQNLGNAFSASVAYGSKRSGIYAAAAMTKRTDKMDADNERENTRATVQYSADGLVVSGMYNQAKLKTAENPNSITLGAAYTMGAFTPKAKVAMIDKNANTTTNKSSTNYAIGLDYALGKKTRAVVEYGVLDKNSETAVNTGDKNTTVFSVGLHHAF